MLRTNLLSYIYNKMISSVVPKDSVRGRDIRTIACELYET